MSHRARRRATGRKSAIKKWPRRSGPFVKSITSVAVPERNRRGRERWIRKTLETEMRQVAVTNRDPCARHQQAVYGGHQPAEQGGRGYEADGSSLGHGYPLFWMAEELRFVIWEQFMYTRYQRQPICLHGTIS